MATKRRAAAKVAGSWKCEECGLTNPAYAPKCVECTAGLRDGLLPSDRVLVHVINGTPAAKKGWLSLRESGADDAAILKHLATILTGRGNRRTLDGDICWVTAGGKVQVWFDTLEPDERLGAFEESMLVESIRDIYLIAGPKSDDSIAGAMDLRDDPLPEEAKPTKGKRPSLQAAAAKSAAAAAPAQLRLPVAAIFAKNNPREHFDDAGLQRLAESIRQNDVIEPLVVRPADAEGRYELLAGERRLRAAKLAKLKDVPVVVRTCDEAQAAKIRLIENFVREDLNPLEEAKAFQQITAAGVTQQELADELQLTQAHISNRIRLLELPEEWRNRIISQEISASQARALVPWAGRPAVLQAIAKALKDRKRWTSDPMTVQDFERTLRSAVFEASRPMKPRAWENGVPFKPTAAELKELDVVEVKFDSSEKSPRAFNVELWQKIQDRVKAKKADREAKAAEAAKEAGGKLSPAEAKRKAEEAAKKSEARVFAWRTRWYQERIQQSISKASYPQVLRCLLFFACGQKPGRRAEELGRAIAAAGGDCKQKRHGYVRTPDIWEALRTVEASTLMNTLVTSVLGVWWNHETGGWENDVTADEIEVFAYELGVDLRNDWRVDRSFLELFTKDQLLDLASEWGITSHKVWVGARKDKRGELIDTLLAVEESLTGAKKRLPAPKCLLAAKGA